MRSRSLVAVALAAALLGGCAQVTAKALPTAAHSHPVSTPTHTPTPIPTPTSPSFAAPPPSVAPRPPATTRPPETPVTEYFSITAYSCFEPSDPKIPTTRIVFATMEEVWADPRDLFCFTTVKGTAPTPIQFEAVEHELQINDLVGMARPTDTLYLGDLYGSCARRDSPYLQRGQLSKTERIYVEAFLMICPNHPRAEELRSRY